jgi:menaquinone-dependent protoporphyrinogen IX oxidase
MIDKPRRDINIITSELQIALKREAADIIDIGNLLLEAHEQLEHGEWLPWLKLIFGSSIRSAQNYMSAARFASKYATVAHLKLRPTALYVLGQSLETIPLDEINAILKVAETEWVDADRVYDIVNLLHEERLRDTDEELERAENDEADTEAAARSEVDDILDGPSPELPPAPEPTPIDFTLQSFDQAVETLSRLHTKPLNSFVATTHDLEVIDTVAEFMVEVAGHLKKR